MTARVVEPHPDGGVSVTYVSAKDEAIQVDDVLATSRRPRTVGISWTRRALSRA